MAKEEEREAARKKKEAEGNNKKIGKHVDAAKASMGRKDYTAAEASYKQAMAVPCDDAVSSHAI